MFEQLASSLPRAGFASRDKYFENQMFVRICRCVETSPA